jgi:ankyrin repeat protein
MPLCRHRRGPSASRAKPAVIESEFLRRPVNMLKRYFKAFVYIVVISCSFSAHAGPKEEFFHAVSIDAAHIVQSLLKSGIDPNVRDDQGQVALFLALRAEATKVTAVLLAHPGVEVDAVNGNGETPVMMAALRGDLAVVRTLLDRGAALNRDGWSPLHYAASGSSTQLVAWLLDRGAAIDAGSPNGTTPLMMAAGYGAIDSADLLLARGANPSARNQRELTAADFAQGAGREALALRLRPR